MTTTHRKRRETVVTVVHVNRPSHEALVRGAMVVLRHEEEGARREQEAREKGAA